MTIEYLMNKYKKYGIEYNYIKKIITLNKAIPVKEFCKLKCDILKYRAKINEIIVEANSNE